MSSHGGSSQSEEEEQWDDMAIVRAFDEALRDQQSRGKSTSKKREVKPAKRQTRKVSVDEEEAFSSVSATDRRSQAQAYQYPNGNQSMGVDAPGPTEESAAAAQNELYQAAYAHAYAQLQAQFQPATPTAYPQQYGQQYGYPQMPQSYHQYPMPSAPQMPSMPMPPFPNAPGMGGVSAPAPSANDDGLANVLLAWYQSGYYTGRFQAMQEMNAARNQQHRR